MKHDLGAIQQLAEQHGAANCAKINTGKNFNTRVRDRRQSLG
jgi:hypothetical protein